MAPVLFIQILISTKSIQLLTSRLDCDLTEVILLAPDCTYNQNTTPKCWRNKISFLPSYHHLENIFFYPVFCICVGVGRLYGPLAGLDGGVGRGRGIRIPTAESRGNEVLAHNNLSEKTIFAKVYNAFRLENNPYIYIYIFYFLFVCLFRFLFTVLSFRPEYKRAVYNNNNLN